MLSQDMYKHHGELHPTVLTAWIYMVVKVKINFMKILVCIEKQSISPLELVHSGMINQCNKQITTIKTFQNTL